MIEWDDVCRLCFTAIDEHETCDGSGAAHPKFYRCKYGPDRFVSRDYLEFNDEAEALEELRFRDLMRGQRERGVRK